MAPSRPYPFPQVAPGTMRDAYLIATAFEDAARRTEADFPVTARMLRARAHQTVTAMRNTATSEARQLDARGRWASRASKCGPLIQPGPAHVTVATGRATTRDLSHRVICGRTLTGRKVSFGTAATGPDDCPPHWTPCRECLIVLTGSGDPADELFDASVDMQDAVAGAA